MKINVFKKMNLGEKHTVLKIGKLLTNNVKEIQGTRRKELSLLETEF